MLIAALLAVMVTMGLAIVRAVLGPSVYDRILAANVFGTKTVLIIAMLAFLFGRMDVLDIAITYALINFISVIAVLRFIEYGDMAAAEVEPLEATDERH